MNVILKKQLVFRLIKMFPVSRISMENLWIEPNFVIR